MSLAIPTGVITVASCTRCEALVEHREYQVGPGRYHLRPEPHRAPPCARWCIAGGIHGEQAREAGGMRRAVDEAHTDTCRTCTPATAAP